MDDKAKERGKEKTGATKEGTERGREKGRKRRSSTGSNRSDTICDVLSHLLLSLYPYHSISCFYQTTYLRSHCFLMPTVSPSFCLHSGLK